MEQLRDGIAIIRREFPGTFPDYPGMHNVIRNFENLLEAGRGNFLHMELWERDGYPMFAPVLAHCLEGFWKADSKRSHKRGMEDEFRMAGFPPPAASGVMTWGGAIRRMCNSFYSAPMDAEGRRQWADDDGNGLLYAYPDCLQCFGVYQLSHLVPVWLDESEGDGIVCPDYPEW